MSHKQVMAVVLKEWNKHPTVPFGKFLLDAFPGEGVLGLWEISDKDLVRVVRDYYSTKHDPTPGRTLYLKDGKVSETP